MRRRSLLPLVAAAALAAAGCQTAVLHNLDEQASNRALAALQDQGIMASKERSEEHTSELQSQR